MAPTPWSACCSSMASSTSSACAATPACPSTRSEEHTSELQSQSNLVCRLLLEKKKKITHTHKKKTRLRPSHSVVKNHELQLNKRPSVIYTMVTNADSIDVIHSITIVMSITHVH